MAAGHDSEQPTDLYDLLMTLWRRRGLIAACTLAGGVLAFLANSMLPVSYTASVTLMVTEADLGSGSPSGTATGNFRAMFRNRHLAGMLVDEFSLDQSPDNATRFSFPEQNVAVREAAGTDLLELEVTLRDPERAAAVANRLSELVLDLLVQVSSSRSDAARAVLDDMLADAEARYTALNAELLEFRRESQIEMLRAETTTLVTQWGELLRLRVSLETERARLATAEHELSLHDRIVDVRRYLVDDPILLQSFQQSRSDESPLGMELQYEFLNPVYQTLEQQITQSRTTIGALEMTQQQYVGELDLEGDNLAQLSELYAAEVRLGELQLEHEMAERVYTNLKVRHEQTGLDVASRSAGLQVIDEAIPPQSSSSPPTMFNVLMGLMAGFFGSAGFVLVFRPR